jgi:hypothetical protein
VNDDANDDSPRVAAAIRFGAAHDEFDTLLQTMLQVWMALVCVAIVMWVCVRLAYHRALAEWRDIAAATDKEEQADEWADTRRSVWRARRRLMNLQREA